MKQPRSFFTVLFTVVMLIFVLFIVWYLPSAGLLRFQIEDVQKSLETSLGRERKQQHEYDEVVEAIPDVQKELDRILPLVESLKTEVSDLKSERKKLREEKKALEDSSASQDSPEVNGHE